MRRHDYSQVEIYTLRAETQSAEEIYARYRDIVDLYIVAGSELEVNIETAMRNKVLKVQGFSVFLFGGCGICPP